MYQTDGLHSFLYSNHIRCLQTIFLYRHFLGKCQLLYVWTQRTKLNDQLVFIYTSHGLFILGNGSFYLAKTSTVNLDRVGLSIGSTGHLPSGPCHLELTQSHCQQLLARCTVNTEVNWHTAAFTRISHSGSYSDRSQERMLWWLLCLERSEAGMRQAAIGALSCLSWGVALPIWLSDYFPVLVCKINYKGLGSTLKDRLCKLLLQSSLLAASIGNSASRRRGDCDRRCTK